MKVGSRQRPLITTKTLGSAPGQRQGQEQELRNRDQLKGQKHWMEVEAQNQGRHPVSD